MRGSYYLTEKEQAAFRKLPQEEGVGLDFWGSVAHNRGLDPETVIGEGEDDPCAFTAMPYGHNKPWCHPAPLKLIRRARWNGKDVYFEKG